MVLGGIPLEWKQCNVTTVHKAEPQNDPSNYHPISVVSVIAKTLERIVANQLYRYLETNQYLSPFQGAYRGGNYNSTEQILLYAVDTIVNALDCGKIVCTVFLDLCKAFDSLDHSIILHCLSKLGVLGNELKWFMNYLSNCLQWVKLNGKVSSWTTVRGGIPQGSALGPLLILVYVNAMPSVVKFGKLLQFTDDTTLISSGSDIDTVKKQSALSHDLALLSDWISSSRMKLNINKSSIMWFTPKILQNISCPAIFMDDNKLQEVDHQNYLSIIFDKMLR